MMIIVVGVIAAVALYMFGCSKLKIGFICNFKKETPPADTTSAVVGIDPGIAGTPAPVSVADAYPRQPQTVVMEFIANQVVEDIDKYTYRELGSDLVLNLKAEILENYKQWLTQIAEYNDMKLQPLAGRALAKYALLILDVARKHKISLNPAYEAMLRANLFSGSPTMGNTTANFAITLA